MRKKRPYRPPTVDYGIDVLNNMADESAKGRRLPPETKDALRMLLNIKNHTKSSNGEVADADGWAAYVVNLDSPHPHEFNCCPDTFEVTGYTNAEKAAMTIATMADLIRPCALGDEHPLDVVGRKEVGLLDFLWVDGQRKLRKMKAVFRLAIRENGDRVVYGAMRFLHYVE
jgi:hypothetical protein